MKPGDKLHLSLLRDGTLVVRPKVRRIGDLAGLLNRAGRKPIALAGMKVDLSLGDEEQ